MRVGQDAHAVMNIKRVISLLFLGTRTRALATMMLFLTALQSEVSLHAQKGLIYHLRVRTVNFRPYHVSVGVD